MMKGMRGYLELSRTFVLLFSIGLFLASCDLAVQPAKNYGSAEGTIINGWTVTRDTSSKGLAGNQVSAAKAFRIAGAAIDGRISGSSEIVLLTIRGATEIYVEGKDGNKYRLLEKAELSSSDIETLKEARKKAAESGEAISYSFSAQFNAPRQARENWSYNQYVLSGSDPWRLSEMWCWFGRSGRLFPLDADKYYDMRLYEKGTVKSEKVNVSALNTEAERTVSNAHYWGWSDYEHKVWGKTPSNEYFHFNYSSW